MAVRFPPIISINLAWGCASRRALHLSLSHSLSLPPKTTDLSVLADTSLAAAVSEETISVKNERNPSRPGWPMRQSDRVQVLGSGV
ncbi:hypothetical protein OPV22_015561 [Ensete ventricosum]|uniref:Uncharacterized protein n=1 Tax=Ensete ventricosum TaxID=4639 RepID=A0AAV8RDE6_ENSVE|nr:hypothetical protein OPV22_015561 [Ensete ventricosum]